MVFAQQIAQRSNRNTTSLLENITSTTLHCEAPGTSSGLCYVIAHLLPPPPPVRPVSCNITACTCPSALVVRASAFSRLVGARADPPFTQACRTKQYVDQQTTDFSILDVYCSGCDDTAVFVEGGRSARLP